MEYMTMQEMWDIFNSFTSNGPLTGWIGDHWVFLSIFAGMVAALCKHLIPGKKDDEFWRDVRNAVRGAVGKEELPPEPPSEIKTL